MIINELKTGPWNLTDLANVNKINKKVFSIFSCGGGSTMGYKLAGYDVIGCCEIDPEMMSIYKQNHKPKHSYLMGVQDFKNLKDLPDELYNLDILDGSPPCSSFSMAGSREKAWGEKKKFREGQAEQVLDDLFFHFIEVAARLKPKVVIAENVKGLIQGNARGYVKEIFAGFRKAGYDCQLFLLNAAAMGVPQKRERTFFIANRLGKKIKLEFNEAQISLREALLNTKKDGRKLSKSLLDEWFRIKNNLPKKYISTSIANPNTPCSTLTSKCTAADGGVMHYEEPRKFSNSEIIRISTFPEDYVGEVGYVAGMSVPPFMMQRVATEVYKQLLYI